MSTTNSARCCSHIKVSGRRCGSPALRDQFQCYFHSRISRGIQQRPDLLLDAMSVLESPEAVQYSLMLVVDGLLKNRIEPVKARLIIYALRIAARNAKECRFDSRQFVNLGNVTDVPNYAEECANEEEQARLGDENEAVENGEIKKDEVENKAEPGAPFLRDLCAKVGADDDHIEANEAHYQTKPDPSAPVRKYPPQPAASTTTMIERAQAAISGAQHGNWRDLRTALELAGIKPPTTEVSKQE